MTIVNDIVKTAVNLASDVVETATGGLVNPGEILNTVLDNPISDIITLGAGFALTGNPLILVGLVDELDSLLNS